MPYRGRGEVTGVRTRPAGEPWNPSSRQGWQRAVGVASRSSRANPGISATTTTIARSARPRSTGLVIGRLRAWRGRGRAGSGDRPTRAALLPDLHDLLELRAAGEPTHAEVEPS